MKINYLPKHTLKSGKVRTKWVLDPLISFHLTQIKETQRSVKKAANIHDIKSMNQALG